MCVIRGAALAGRVSICTDNTSVVHVYINWIVDAHIEGQIFDLESGQRVDQQFFSVDGKLPWIACVRYLRTDRIEKLELQAHFPEDDLQYDEDVHLLPYRDSDPWHGIHEFSRSCSCCPEIMEQHRERTLVIHMERD
jgi:hypothetical protein